MSFCQRFSLSLTCFLCKCDNNTFFNLLVLTKQIPCALMYLSKYSMTLTENLLDFKAAESRRLVRVGVERFCDLIPESVL